MTTLTLKPQWQFSEFADGRIALTSENFHWELDTRYASVLRSLVQGVDPATLDDAQFTQIQYLTDCGLLNVDSASPSAPIWELSGANYHSVQEQFKHLTFTIADKTNNEVGLGLHQAMLEAGIVPAPESVAPKLTIVVTSSFLLVPVAVIPTLPVICNRMRISVGPLLFPGGPHIRDDVLLQESYLANPRYQLTPSLDALQRAWINQMVINFFSGPKLRYGSNIIEYNLATQELKSWPVKY